MQTVLFDRVYPENAAIAEMGVAELFVIAAIRLWVAPVRDPFGFYPDWKRSFEVAGLEEDGTAGFDSLLDLVKISARRNLDVRCPNCPHLGDDEGSLLRLVSLLQCGRAKDAERILADWLPANAALSALPHARGFAQAMAEAELFVPLRSTRAARSLNAVHQPTSECTFHRIH